MQPSIGVAEMVKAVVHKLKLIRNEISEIISDLEIESADPPIAEAIPPIVLATKMSRVFRIDLSKDDSILSELTCWRILNEIYIANINKDPISISDIGLAVDMPTTTSLRWLGALTDRGLIIRTPDSNDKRRHFLALTDLGFESVQKWLSKVHMHLSGRSITRVTSAARR